MGVANGLNKIVLTSTAYSGSFAAARPGAMFQPSTARSCLHSAMILQAPRATLPQASCLTRRVRPRTARSAMICIAGAITTVLIAAILRMA